MGKIKDLYFIVFVCYKCICTLAITSNVTFVTFKSLHKYLPNINEENYSAQDLPIYIKAYQDNSHFAPQEGLSNFQRCQHSCAERDTCNMFAMGDVCEHSEMTYSPETNVMTTQPAIFVSVTQFVSHLSVDECAGVSCLHGGTCVDRIFTYTCQCALGYGGTHCETNLVRSISIVGNPAYSSSSIIIPTKANDGNTDGNQEAGSCYHSLEESTPVWWAVDLDRDTYVTSLEISNRVDCCGERMANFVVYLMTDTYNPLDATDKRVCVSMPSVYEHQLVHAPCDVITLGRYLGLQFNVIGQVVNFCEVNVNGFYPEEMEPDE